MLWKMSLVFIFAFLAMNVLAAEHQEMSALPKNSDDYAEITADQLNAALKNKEFTLVNVHIPYEGEIPRTDLQIPFNRIADNLEKLPGKDQPIVVYCRSGSMSKTASRELVRLGYTNIVELTGGFNAWKQAGYELLTEQPSTPAFTPDVELQLTATRKTMSILPGKLTEVWTYQGKLLKGEARNLTELPQSYLGPIIRVRTGQKLRVFFINNLPESSIIHWHGLHLPEDMDGHPRYAIAPGKTFVYEFEVLDRAGTYWYHPHPHERSGSQVYFGLAGLLLIEDAEEQAVGLPTGEFDLPFVIQDRTFAPDGTLRYFPPAMPHGMADMADMGHMEPMAGMAQQIHGFSGETILVNGLPNYAVSVQAARYRFRLLNGSNARVYKLAWTHHAQFTVIGADGGLLDAPVQKEYLVLGPGERIEALVDFSEIPVGTTIRLRSLAFEAGMAMPMDASDTMPGMDLTHSGKDLRIADFTVRRQGPPVPPMPATLVALEAPDLKAAVNAANPRTFTFETTANQATINGRVFEMNAVAPDEIVKLGDTEVWELINGGHNQMPHPVHIHGRQFRIISREGEPPEFEAGYVDGGWKDTVLLMPGEKVRLVIRFADFTGIYVYHCHLLEHEDLGMMRNYQIIR